MEGMPQMLKGIIGKKVGMTQIYQPDGVAVPVTVIQAGPCWVTQIKSEERDGYLAVQLGYEEIGAGLDEKAQLRKAERRLNKAQRGHLGLVPATDKHAQRRQLAAAVPPLRHLREFRVATTDLNGISEGYKITVEVFNAGERVDIVGISKGKGFAGGIKRHHFNRQPKTHGQSDRERAPGSAGAGSTPGRTMKGKRNAGHMGSQRVTAQNLEIVVVDAERNLIAVRGSIPGASGGLVILKPTLKKK